MSAAESEIYFKMMWWKNLSEMKNGMDGFEVHACRELHPLHNDLLNRAASRILHTFIVWGHSYILLFHNYDLN